MPEPTIEELESMSLEDLRALADAAPTAEVTAPPVDTPAPPVAPPAPTKFRREIDLGDGAGKQVFEADTMDALVDKLTEAQANATRKIRELNRDLKERTNPEAPKPLTADEEFVLAQKMLANPSQGVKEAIERMFGKSVDQIREDIQNSAQEAAENRALRAQKAWTEAHPEYYASPGNGQRMMQYLEVYQLPITSENIQRAYEAVKDFLESKPGPKGNTAPRSRASGLSASASATPPAPKGEPTEEELYKMPMDKFLELGGRGRSSSDIL